MTGKPAGARPGREGSPADDSPDLWTIPKRPGLLEYVEDFMREWRSTLRDPVGRAILETALRQAWKDGLEQGGLSCCGTISDWHRPWCHTGPRRHR